MTQNNATNGIEEQFLFPSEREDRTVEMNTSLRIDDVTLERLDDLVDESEESEIVLTKGKIVNALVYAVWAAEIGGDSNEGDDL